MTACCRSAAALSATKAAPRRAPAWGELRRTPSAARWKAAPVAGQVGGQHQGAVFRLHDAPPAPLAAPHHQHMCARVLCCAALQMPARQQAARPAQHPCRGLPARPRHPRQAAVTQPRSASSALVSCNSCSSRSTEDVAGCVQGVHVAAGLCFTPVQSALRCCRVQVSGAAGWGRSRRATSSQQPRCRWCCRRA